jgi:hypothetical protein
MKLLTGCLILVLFITFFNNLRIPASAEDFLSGVKINYAQVGKEKVVSFVLTGVSKDVPALRVEVAFLDGSKNTSNVSIETTDSFGFNQGQYFCVEPIKDDSGRKITCLGIKTVSEETINLIIEAVAVAEEINRSKGSINEVSRAEIESLMADFLRSEEEKNEKSNDHDLSVG